MQTFDRLVAVAGTTLFVALPVGAQQQADSGNTKGSLLTVTVSAATGRSLEGALVRLPDVDRRGRTDWIGEARFYGLKPGKHTVQVRHLGFAPATIDLMVQGDSTEAVFMLEQIADTLAPITVTATWLTPYQKDFEIRRRKGIGRFASEEQLEKFGFQQLALVLPRFFPGIRAVSDQGMAGRYILQSIRGGSATNPWAGCGVDIYLDGFQIEPEMFALYPTDLYGAELYPRESAPVQYKRGFGGRQASCFVLLLWSRW